MKILSALSTPRTLRSMAVTVCVLTNIYFVLIFVVSRDESIVSLVNAMRLTIGVGMLLLFLALRHALREITAPNASELDEMQLELRDEAYQLGYLVVRRVGLGVSIAGALLLPMLKLMLALGLFSKDHSRLTSTNFGFITDTKAARDYVQLYFSGENLLQVGYGLVLVMTFAAYCFPLVILAWRYARIQAAFNNADVAPGGPNSGSPVPRPTIDSAHPVKEVLRVVKAFRRQLTVVAIGWPGIFALALLAHFCKPRSVLASTFRSLLDTKADFGSWVSPCGFCLLAWLNNRNSLGACERLVLRAWLQSNRLKSCDCYRFSQVFSVP